MKKKTKQEIIDIINNFALPSYQDIPEMGLYLEQCVQYVNYVYRYLPNMEITSSMVSNYVKKGIIDRPVKKNYSRDQICYLIFIVLAKTVLTMDEISFLFYSQKKDYPEEIAYEYLHLELKNILSYVFGLKDKLEPVGTTNTDTKTLLRNTILSVSYKIHLQLYLQGIKKECEENES